jgi:MFS family permease
VVGGLIDRVGRRAVSALSDILSCLSVMLFVVGETVTELTYLWIALFAVLGAVFDPAGYTARKALIPNAAHSSGMSVEKANGRHEGFFAIGWMIGPAAGAWFIEVGGQHERALLGRRSRSAIDARARTPWRPCGRTRAVHAGSARWLVATAQ